MNWVVIMNGIAVVLCAIAFIVNVYVGAWIWAFVQLLLMILNVCLVYVNYKSYKNKRLEKVN